MRRPLLSRGRLLSLAACLVCLFAVTLFGQQKDPQHNRVALLTDWTSRHVLYPLSGPADRMSAAQRDPRARFSWVEHDGTRIRFQPRRPIRSERPGFDRDWSINLGAGGTAANMYPAKFTFDITAAPSCSSDYIIYPVNTSGSPSQANLVAFNNLYSGTAGGTGICNAPSAGRPTAPDDDGTDATVMWSYNVNAAGGSVPTSPVISWDYTGVTGSVLGTKVAFVESASGGQAHFHVLAWKAGDGVDTTDPDGLQNTRKPAPITMFVSTDPVAGSGTATDLPLTADFGGPDTFSSPFVDYTNDYAYVANDAGDLYRIKDVFCPSYNTDAGCTAGLAPSLDTSWGSGHGYVEVGGGVCTPMGTVEDAATGDVFVGCSNGVLYGYTSTGTPLAPGRSITIGNGSTFGGIVVPPIVDSSNGFVYVVTGTTGTTPAIVQVPINSFSVNDESSAALGHPAGENLSIPTFNDAYLSSVTSADWGVFSCGYDSSGTLTYLYIVGFNSSRVMNSGTPPSANQFQLASSVEACSPLTGFVNAVGPPFPPNDWLFVGLSTGSVNNYEVSVSAGVTGSGGFPVTFSNTATPYTVTGGPSGMIPDNESTDTQASSIYFSGLGAEACVTGGTGYCAVKLTQAGLN
jgi:hypothetical protein